MAIVACRRDHKHLKRERQRQEKSVNSRDSPRKALLKTDGNILLKWIRWIRTSKKTGIFGEYS
jgi:hypothetical protein